MDHRRNDLDAKPGGTPWTAALCKWIRAALERADVDHGVTRKRIARLLRVSEDTLTGWLVPSRPQVIRGDALVQLIVREDLLPEVCRHELIARLALEAGGAFVPDEDDAESGRGDPGRVDPRRGVSELAVGVGEFAVAVEEALAKGSPGGESLTREEAEAHLRVLDQLAHRVRRVRSRLRARAKGGA